MHCPDFGIFGGEHQLGHMVVESLQRISPPSATFRCSLIRGATSSWTRLIQANHARRREPSHRKANINYCHMVVSLGGESHNQLLRPAVCEELYFHVMHSMDPGRESSSANLTLSGDNPQFKKTLHAHAVHSIDTVIPQCVEATQLHIGSALAPLLVGPRSARRGIFGSYFARDAWAHLSSCTHSTAGQSKWETPHAPLC